MTFTYENDYATGTVLSKYMNVQDFSRLLVSYLGVTTPRGYDAAELENEALLKKVAVHDLGWLRRIAVRGEDRFRWLSGMVTNGVETLADQHGAYNLVLNAQGRIQGDCSVWRNGDLLEIEVAADQAEALLAHFDKFIIMDDVELIPVEGVSALGVTGPLADEVLSKIGLPTLSEVYTSVSAVLLTGVLSSVSTWDVVRGETNIPLRVERGFGTLVPHYVLWAAPEQIPVLVQTLFAEGAVPVGVRALETLRVVEGIPAYGVDIQSRDLAQETSQDRALSFSKGCYLGQEIVERVRSRGQVHRHLRLLELIAANGQFRTEPQAGIELRVAGSAEDAKPAAVLTSVAVVSFPGWESLASGGIRFFGLAMVRAEAEVGRGDLVFEGGTARILSAPPKFTKDEFRNESDGLEAAEEMA